ncbi:hypothetical protein [Brevundimonas sp.]|uniref:hypothetical protein n=1 Tax=Brevundimonas sp. TaxID=1871086 RepID=UPI003D13526C
MKRARDVKILFAIMAATAVVLAGPVRAQDYAFQGFAASDAMNQMQAASRDAMVGSSGTEASSRSVRAPAETASVTYRVDPSVRRGVEQRIVEAVSRRDPTGAQQLSAAFRQRDFVQLFDRGVSRFGLRSGNVVDATAAYWLAMWGAANDQREPYSRTQAQAVRAQVASGFDFSRAGLRTSAQRQEYAETLIYQAMLLDSAVDEAQRAGRTDDVRTLGDEAQRQMRAAGMDLRRLRLTDRGFVPIA